MIYVIIELIDNPHKLHYMYVYQKNVRIVYQKINHIQSYQINFNLQSSTVENKPCLTFPRAYGSVPPLSNGSPQHSYCRLFIWRGRIYFIHVDYGEWSKMIVTMFVATSSGGAVGARSPEVYAAQFGPQYSPHRAAHTPPAPPPAPHAAHTPHAPHAPHAPHHTTWTTLRSVSNTTTFASLVIMFAGIRKSRKKTWYLNLISMRNTLKVY